MAASATFMGIPRESIPWFPTIDEDVCTQCGECLDICPNGVFAQNNSEAKTEVANPYNCVVLCDKCASFCPSEAISFPDKDATKHLLTRLKTAVRQKGSV
jgi:NAD-dependent dihydropyrimidine dehydrogenase PreA subunit